MSSAIIARKRVIANQNVGLQEAEKKVKVLIKRGRGRPRQKKLPEWQKKKEDDKEKEKEVEEAWSAVIDSDELPELVECSDSKEEDDLDVEIGSQSKTPDDEGAYSGLEVIQLAGVAENSVKVDLYDSGATHHMSGFRHKFINFVDIEPIPITAADK